MDNDNYFGFDTTPNKDTLSLSEKLWRSMLFGLNGIKQAIHVIILISFMLVALAMLSVFFSDMVKLHQKFSEPGVLQAFGTLLVLWTITELIHAELAVLNGHKFGVAVLIDVALAAIVRKMLTADFEGGSGLLYDLFALVVLALVRRFVLANNKTKTAKLETSKTFASSPE